MSWDQMELKKVDYAYWNYVVFVTLNEFIYLGAGYEPLHVGAYGNAYLNLSNNEFKDYYKKIKRLGDELPAKSTSETLVKDFLTPEPKYEATYLLKWVRSKGIQINLKYMPIESEERKRQSFIQDYVGRLALYRDEFIKILAHYNPSKDEEYFKIRILDAIQLNQLKSIPIPFDGSVPFEHRNFKFQIQTLIDFAVRMQWNLPEEFNSKDDNNIKEEAKLRSYFKDGEMMIDGIIDVRQIESTKLVLALENYILNMRGDSKRIPSTESVKTELVSKYEEDGVSVAMARTIDECSRHDSRSNSPPKSARKKTIFYQ